MPNCKPESAYVVARMCYAVAMSMTVLSQRELRNSSAQVMDRLEQGEEFTVTRNNRPVGKLIPLAGTEQGLTPHRFVRSEDIRALGIAMPHIDCAQMRRDGDEAWGDDGDRIG